MHREIFIIDHSATTGLIIGFPACMHVNHHIFSETGEVRHSVYVQLTSVLPVTCFAAVLWPKL